MEYENLTLECTVSKPDRLATWYKNGVKIMPSDKVKVTSKDKTHTLVVERCEAEDQAEYAIKVDDLSSKCQVTVEG
jgi:hypothetical protein